MAGSWGRTGSKPAGKAGREGEHKAVQLEAAVGFSKLGKIPTEVRSNSRVYKKLINVRGSSWGWRGREKSKEGVPGVRENQAWEITDVEKAAQLGV